MAFLWQKCATFAFLCLSVFELCQAQSANVGPPLGTPESCDRCPLDSYCDVRSGGEAVCRRCTVCNGSTIEVSRCSRFEDRVCRCSFPLGDRCGQTTVRSAHWIGYLNNAADLQSSSSTSNSAAATFNTIQNLTDSGSTAIVKSGTAGISFRQPGVVIFSYHQDVIHQFDYLTLFARLNGQILTHELNKATNQKWDGIATGGSVRVAPGDNLAFYFDLSRARPPTSSVRIDNGKWGVASALWISESAGAQTLRLRTANAHELVPAGGRVKFSRADSSREIAFQPQFSSGDIRFAKGGIVHFAYHLNIKSRCHNLKLRASLSTAMYSHYTLPGAQRAKILVKEEQDNTYSAYDGLSVSGSTPVREGDSFALDLDALDSCVAGIHSGALGVLSMLYLPNDVAWSSGPVQTVTGHIEGTALGSVQFAANPGTSGDPVQIEGDVVRFLYYGNAVYDLHLAVDNQCSSFAYLEAKINRVVVGRELISGPTSNMVEGISLSGSVTVQPGHELVFILSCVDGHFRKIRNGSLSVLFLSKRP